MTLITKILSRSGVVKTKRVIIDKEPVSMFSQQIRGGDGTCVTGFTRIHVKVSQNYKSTLVYIRTGDRGPFPVSKPSN